jgi:cytochrome c oxidase subunit 2
VIFDAAGCTGCHKINPEYPNGGDTGPDLTGIGARPKIPTSQPTLDVNEQGLAAWIRDPEATKPGALMPAFGPDVITDEDMPTLVRWLLGHR